MNFNDGMIVTVTSLGGVGQLEIIMPSWWRIDRWILWLLAPVQYTLADGRVVRARGVPR